MKFKPNMTSLKKYGVIVLTAVLLVAAVYVNYRINLGDTFGENKAPILDKADEDEDAVQSGAGTNYFAAFREQREKDRQKEVEYLNLIIEDERTDKETLKDAQEQLMEIVNSIETEFLLETQLMAKGFNDVAVTLRKGAVNVIVDSKELTKEQVAQIVDIVIRETGADAKDIKVTGKSS